MEKLVLLVFITLIGTANAQITIQDEVANLSGVYVLHQSGLNCGINYRSVAGCLANINRSLMAERYRIIEFSVAYKQEPFELGTEIENLLISDWHKDQFEMESRVRPDAASTTEFHLMSSAPLSVRGRLLII